MVVGTFNKFSFQTLFLLLGIMLFVTVGIFNRLLFLKAVWMRLKTFLKKI